MSAPNPARRARRQAVFLLVALVIGVPVDFALRFLVDGYHGSLPGTAAIALLGSAAIACVRAWAFADGYCLGRSDAAGELFRRQRERRRGHV